MQPDENKLGYDIVDDVVVFMRNDPVFYRKHYFPAMAKLADTLNTGKEINRKSQMNPLVDSGINTYCKKFNLPKKPADLFTLDDRSAIMDRIYSEELENIKKGEYQ